jgi:hypothetical protein
MHQLQLNISQETLDRLAQVLDQPEDALPALALAALDEWVGWLSGDLRPMSITELETERILKLYDTVLPDQLPSVDNLGRLLGLPMGRARYIIQNMAYRRGRFLFQRQLRDTLRALHDGQWRDDTCTVLVDRGCQQIVDRTLADLLANRRISSTVAGVAVLDGVRYVLGAGHHRALLEEIQRQLDGLAR